jgi:hypothetical protein
MQLHCMAAAAAVAPINTTTTTTTTAVAPITTTTTTTTTAAAATVMMISTSVVRGWWCWRPPITSMTSASCGTCHLQLCPPGCVYGQPTCLHQMAAHGWISSAVITAARIIIRHVLQEYRFWGCGRIDRAAGWLACAPPRHEHTTTAGCLALHVCHTSPQPPLCHINSSHHCPCF